MILIVRMLNHQPKTHNLPIMILRIHRGVLFPKSGLLKIIPTKIPHHFGRWFFTRGDLESHPKCF